jgi:two-component system cell cycle sensor histidine kinase/response regulator CckA
VNRQVHHAKDLDTTAISGQSDDTILVCEDDEQLRTLIEIMLSEHGYRVLLAGRPEKALELAAEHADSIDVLVTDVELPRMSGFELAERLHTSHPSTEILMLSGRPPEANRATGLPDRCAFLQKPFSEIALVEVIRVLLESHHRHHH